MHTDNQPFDINRVEQTGQKQARLPTIEAQFGLPQGQLVHDVNSYVAAMQVNASQGPRNQLDETAKALGISVPQAYSYANFSFMPDAGNWGLMQWPGVNPESLRKITRENVAPQMIMAMRRADFARYAPVSTRPWEPGWKIQMRDNRATPSAQDRRDMKSAESFIYNGSRDYDYQDARERDAKLLSPFGTFLRQFADDIHTFDGWALWTQPDRIGRPMAFANLPAGMIRLAVPGKGIKNDPRLFAALVDETSNPVKSFTRQELTWRVMNPRTDPAAMGYGWPIPEQGARLIQAFQSAIDLNASTFDKNGIPNGMLLLKGDYYNQEQIDALMREWTNMKRGISKTWGLPVMSVPEDSEIELLNFMDLKGEEVRYRDHMNMMAGLYAIISQFPVSRLGLFASGRGKDNTPAKGEATEIQGVDDPGLPSTLQFVEDTVNAYLLWPIWPHLSFVFMAKNPVQDARSYQELTKARTWKEARAEADLPDLTSTVPKELKPLAEIMNLAPEDTSKMAAFQTVAVKMLEILTGTTGTEGGGKDPANPGAPFPPMKDPAVSQAHGHRVGVRRSAVNTRGKE